MLKFPTMYSREKSGRTYSAVGSPDKVLYSAKYRDDGTIELSEKGKESLYDFIQSFRDSCDINLLVARFSNGDIDALSQVQGAYGDFTRFPKTYAELLNCVNDGRLMFSELPLEIRAKFNQDFAQFMAAMDKPDFWELLKPAPVEEESEVTHEP